MLVSLLTEYYETFSLLEKSLPVEWVTVDPRFAGSFFIDIDTGDVNIYKQRQFLAHAG